MLTILELETGGREAVNARHVVRVRESRPSTGDAQPASVVIVELSSGQCVRVIGTLSQIVGYLNVRGYA